MPQARRRFLQSTLALAALPALSFAQPRPVLKAGDQKGGLRALLEAADALNGVPYDIQWTEFPAAAPLAEALNAGAVELGPIGDAPAIFALAAGTRIKLIGANRSGPLRHAFTPVWRHHRIGLGAMHSYHAIAQVK